MRANSVGKKCVEVNRAYVAGLLDGDGSIMAIIEPHREKQFGFRVRIILKITQKKRSDVSFLPDLLQCGAIRKNRATHDWITRDQQAVKRVLKTLSPYCRSKQKQLRLALKILHSCQSTKADLLRNARWADALSRLNVRSNKRRKNYVTMIQAHFSSND